MRQRNWTFYKIILYLGLAGAIGLIILLCYIILYRSGDYWHNLTVGLTLLGSCLQTIFYLMCIRLVHKYVPARLQTGKPFNIVYTVLLIFNSCIAIGLLLLLALAFSETLLKPDVHLSTDDYLALATIGGYTFVTIYISAASVVLRRYNRYQVATDEEKWLSQLGNPSLNP